MSGSTTTSVTVGPSFPTLLTVLFVALKLTGVIAWSWLWVLSPLWISAALAALFIGVVLVFIGTTTRKVVRKWH